MKCESCNQHDGETEAPWPETAILLCQASGICRVKGAAWEGEGNFVELPLGWQMGKQPDRYLDLLNFGMAEEAYAKVKQMASSLTDDEHLFDRCISNRNSG